MSVTTPKSAFWRGFRDSAPFVIVVGPFGLVFGVIATEAGLSVIEVMGFTVLVIAGASQLAAIQLMIDNAPTVIVLISALAVNLRMAMYSAALAPHLGQAPLWQRAVAAYFLVDQSYAVSALKFDTAPDMPLRAKVGYFFGTVAPVAPVWYGFTLLGAVVGQAIPPEYALDSAVPIAFLALIAPALRTPAHVVAALVSVGVALALAWLPFNLGLLVAAALGMAAGAEVERRAERARARMGAA